MSAGSKRRRQLACANSAPRASAAPKGPARKPPERDVILARKRFAAAVEAQRAEWSNELLVARAARRARTRRNVRLFRAALVVSLVLALVLS